MFDFGLINEGQKQAVVTTEGNPVISFDRSGDAIDKTVAKITQTVHDIENKKFDEKVQNSYACEFCDMKYVCGKCHV